MNRRAPTMVGMFRAMVTVPRLRWWLVAFFVAAFGLPFLLLSTNLNEWVAAALVWLVIGAVLSVLVTGAHRDVTRRSQP